jgi:RNA polymerase sigma factor (sigma-70 family)
MLMERYGDELMRTAYMLVKDRQTAEEAVMDTFIQAYSSIGQLREPDKLRGWLLRIAVNRCRMRMRQWSWRSLLPYETTEKSTERENSEYDPEEQLLLEWRNEQLSEAIRHLDYKYKEAIVCYYYHELSIQEISQLLGCSQNTVKSRLARGRRQLRDILAKEGVEHELRKTTH